MHSPAETRIGHACAVPDALTSALAMSPELPNDLSSHRHLSVHARRLPTGSASGAHVETDSDDLSDAAPAPADAESGTAWNFLPFAVRHSPAAQSAAEAVALAVHRAREVLARRLGVVVPVRVLVVDGPCAAGTSTLRAESTLWIPSQPCAGWSELARMLDDRLPQRSRLLLRKAMGRAAGPLDLTSVAHSFAIDAYAAALARAAGSRFPRAWIAYAFEACARVVTLAEADPEALARQAYLAEVVCAVLPPSFGLADPDVRGIVERIEATRDAVHAHARRGFDPLARFLRAFPRGAAPRTDSELARHMVRELGDAAFLPTIEALAA